MPSHPLTRLTLLFTLYKLLLLLLALACPGVGYDTSADVLLHPSSPAAAAEAGGWDRGGVGAVVRALLRRLVLRLVRWDAIYFTTAAVRGYRFEQEWAFSRVFSWCFGVGGEVIPPLSSPTNSFYTHALSGIIISTLAHYLSVLVLFFLARRLLAILLAHRQQKASDIAVLTASLHIISPAGLFLSAPYGESTFALANFLGFYFYVGAGGLPSFASTSTQSPGRASISLLLSAACFGAASLVRSNGILGGLLFLWDALAAVPQLPSLLTHLFSTRENTASVIRLAVTVLGGILIFASYVAPQTVAYVEYCMEGRTRPWCTQALPSIYGFVQSYYWDVGFGRYWTLSNTPLFLLATPMLILLTVTALVALRWSWPVGRAGVEDGVVRILQAHAASDASHPSPKPRPATHTASDATPSAHAAAISHFNALLARFALPQLLLAVLAATTFHVQIINRISSGYPVWYLIIAIAITARDPTTSAPQIAAGGRKQPPQVRNDATTTKTLAARTSHTTPDRLMRTLTCHVPWIVRVMVMYGIVQGGLYASFLPPA